MEEEVVEASRALVGYFNHRLAERLAEYVLKHSSPGFQKRFSESVLNLVPDVCKIVLWNALVERVKQKSEAYLGSATFQKQVDSCVERNANAWLAQAVEIAMKEKAALHVKDYLRGYDGQALVKTIPGRMQVAVEQAIAAAAKEKLVDKS